jgi:hypothetical protein
VGCRGELEAVVGVTDGDGVGHVGQRSALRAIAAVEPTPAGVATVGDKVQTLTVTAAGPATESVVGALSPR